MLTHNQVIYHCLRCGAILHCERDEEIPCCCGRPMINAAAQTVTDDPACRTLETPAEVDDRAQKNRRKGRETPR